MPKTLAMAQMYREAIQCERLRAEVFAGQAVAGRFSASPTEWLALLIESLLVTGTPRAGEAQSAARARLRGRAGVGRIDRRRSRSNGLPTPTCVSARCARRSSTAATTGCRSRGLARIDLEAPADLRDVVWMPAHFQFTNGGEAVGVIPTRYPGSEARRRSADPAGAEDRLERGGRRRLLRARTARADDRRRRARRDGRALDPDRLAAVEPGRSAAMPELTPQERLQPALLDRLTDEEPDKTAGAARAARDVEEPAAPGGAARPRVALQCDRLEVGGRSRAGAARPALGHQFRPAGAVGRAASSLDVAELERAIRQAILDFEPRILPGDARR